MTSVFESFGWKIPADSTPVYPLGTFNRPNEQQLRSKLYFEIEKDAKAADGNVLAIKPKDKQFFDLKKAEHKEYLKACVNSFKDTSNALKAIDRKIVFSTLLSMVSLPFTWIPVIGFLNLLCMGYSVYHLGKREVLVKEYKESLNLLVASCNWALGQNMSERCSNKEALTTDTDLRDMMTTLYPVLTEQQTRHVIADDIEEVFAKELRDYESKYQFPGSNHRFFSSNADERIARSKRGAEWSRCVYGHDKGQASDYLDAFITAFPDIYKAIQHGFQQVRYWWNNDTKNQTTTETPSMSA